MQGAANEEDLPQEAVEEAEEEVALEEGRLKAQRRRMLLRGMPAHPRLPGRPEESLRRRV